MNSASLAPVVHPAGCARAAHDRLSGEAADAEGQPLEAVAELGAHYVVQDGVDGLKKECHFCQNIMNVELKQLTELM